MVIACRTPSLNFSTKCKFSDPEVKKETRPEKEELQCTGIFQKFCAAEKLL